MKSLKFGIQMPTLPDKIDESRKTVKCGFIECGYYPIERYANPMNFDTFMRKFFVPGRQYNYNRLVTQLG
jgi:hypothetical protein